MKTHALIVCILVLSGCGPTIVTARQQQAAAQANSDLNAALDYAVEDDANPEGVRLAAWDAKLHAANMAKAMEIEQAELPKPRVSKAQWREDAKKAHAESSNNTTTDNDSIANFGWKAMLGVGVAFIFAKGGQVALANTPLAPLMNIINHLMGGENPKRRKVYEKLLTVLQEYKATDPAWRTNPLYDALSAKFTQADKDFIKNETHEL